MTPLPLPALLVALAGAFLTLDRVAFLQSLAARPLPTATLVGLILGEVQLGLMCGVTLELVWLSRQPVGGSVPPDETLAALAAVVAATGAPVEWSGYARCAAGALIGLPYGLLGRRLEIMARKANAVLVERARAGLKELDFAAPGKAQASGALNFFLVGLVGSLIAAFTANHLSAYLTSLAPVKLERAFAAMAVVMPVVGAGAIVASMGGRRPVVLFLAGAAGALVAAKSGLACALGGFRSGGPQG